MLQRERDQVQIGLDPARAVRLACTPAVRRTLRVLTEGGPATGCDPDVLDRLSRWRLLDEPPASRQRARVLLRACGPVPPAVPAALAQAGLDLHESADVGPPDSVAGDAGPDIGLLVCVGEPHRELVDDWTAQGRHHLVLRFTEGDVVVGPFVVPGVTACLRCVDAHHTDRDPRWPLLVEQQARQQRRRDGVPDPVDPVMAGLAAAWVARDLLTATDELGGVGVAVPATWSTTIRLPPRLAGLEATSWWRHRACGCSAGGPPVGPPVGADDATEVDRRQ